MTRSLRKACLVGPGCLSLQTIRSADFFGGILYNLRLYIDEHSSDRVGGGISLYKRSLMCQEPYSPCRSVWFRNVYNFEVVVE